MYILAYHVGICYHKRVDDPLGDSGGFSIFAVRVLQHPGGFYFLKISFFVSITNKLKTQTDENTIYLLHKNTCYCTGTSGES